MPQSIMGATNLLLQDLAKFCTTEKLFLRISPAAVLFCESTTPNEQVARPSYGVNSSIIPAEHQYITAVFTIDGTTTS